jgi:hypothetical protein
MNQTPIYQLGYFIPNMTIGNDLDLDKNRFTTIENQLYNVYNIFGNGVLTKFDENGKQIPSWNLSAVPSQKTIRVSDGKGHVNYKYAETSDFVDVNLILPGSATSGTFIYYFYAVQNVNTPVDKSVNFTFSLTQINDPTNYIGLGAAELTLNTDGSFTLVAYNDVEHGRQEISLFSSLTGLVKNHKHIGGLNNPSPIDLSKHVTGFLSADNIEGLDLSRVTSGTLSANRLPVIDHNTLTNIGTLTHEQIDALLASLQYPDQNYSLSDYGIVNRLQIVLALKKQSGFFNIDGEQINSIFYVPYAQMDKFVDYTNTTALINTELHRVYGTTGLARQSNVIKVDTTQDFKTALFYAEDSIPNPTVSNIEVTGVTTTPVAGTLNIPYGLTGSANTIYISSAQDSFVSSFSTTGVYRNRRIDFDSNLNLNSPLGLWFDNVKNYLYIADTYNHRIIVTDSNFSSVIAKVGANNASGVPGSGNGVGFNYPKGVFGLGNTFYVADSGNNQIQKYSWSGGVPVYQRTYKYSDSTILGLNQSLNDPRGLIATSFRGNNYLFVSDYNNHRVLCGIETNNKYSVYQILGGNSGGFGIFNTSLITYNASSSVTGIGASFTFNSSFNGVIRSIGVSSSGAGYSNNDSFILKYNGNQNGLFNVLTDGAGRITTAFVSYGINTANIFGFDHPQGLAINGIGSRLDMLITDTDNNRIINYRSVVGVGTTSGQFVYSYNIGTSGSLGISSLSIYMQRPAGVYAQQGFSTIFVADSLNNRVHSLATSFANNSIGGITTFTFGIGDTSLTSGGITLTKPISYLGISTPSVAGSATAGWFVGEQIAQGTQFQSDSIDRYSYVTFSTKTLTIQDTIAVSIATLNETTERTLGQISCYLIFADNFSGGTLIPFSLSNNTNRNSIKISEKIYTIRLNGSTTSQFYDFADLTLFTEQPNPSIIGFGFKWSTSTGWTNNDSYQLGWYLPQFSTQLLQTNYPKVLAYRQANGLQNSIFAFNANRYAGTGTFVFRFDSGVAGNATFDNVIYSFATPYSPKGTSSIQFYYRVDDTLDQLNLDSYTLNPLYPISGGSYNINKTGRYIDLVFILNAASVDQLAAPVISSIALNYSVYGKATGIIYDTNVNNAPQGLYPRLKWTQGESSNISIVPVPNDNNQSYQIEIEDTANIGKYIYLSTNNLELTDSSDTTGFVDINNNLYLSPYQAFAELDAGLLNPQHFYSNGQSGYFIADTDNDRVIEVDSTGAATRAIQGNIKLPRCDRAFAILGVFYNTNTRQLYATFSQYLIFAADYLQSLSVSINGVSYSLTNSAYFDQNNVGLFSVNSNNQSATFYVTVTRTMDALLTENPYDARFEIQNPATNPPFLLPTTGRSDGNQPENETLTYTTSQFDEFTSNSALGLGTILDYTSNVVVNVVDPVTFGTATETSTELWSYWQGTNQFPNYSNFYSIPIQVFPIYFDNIFKPLHVDYTEAGALVISTVGNNAIRAYNENFVLGYKISLSSFTFNEKLGGSTVVLDRAADESGNVLLVAQPGISTDNITGKAIIYNRNSGSLVNQYTFSNFDAVKAYSEDDGYLILLNDRLGGIRSKLVKVGQDGSNQYTLSNAFSRPVSLEIKENGYYYVTDLTGQYGTIFFRTFVADGSGNSTGSSSSGGGGSTGGGNAGGGIIGGTTGGTSGGSTGGGNIIGGGGG